MAPIENPPNQPLPKDHFYFIFDDKPLPGAITEASFILTFHYLKSITKNESQWKRDTTSYKNTWTNNAKEQVKSKPINYLIFAQNLRENGKYIPQSLNLPEMECYWLDKSVDLSINFHMIDKAKKEALTMQDGTPERQFGTAYPIKPKLDREGHFFTTFQPQLIKKIIARRNELVNTSDKALDYNWVMELRYLINDTFSLLEITLNQFYIKAKYNPETGWKFDEKIVGDKNGRRLLDKLKWIRQITGKEFNCEPERQSLMRLKEVRNHFNHFDPPSLVITLEEVEIWLNDIITIGFLLVRLRKSIGVNISDELVNLIIQKRVIFTPQEAFKERLPLDSKKTGYYSSQWPENKGST